MSILRVPLDKDNFLTILSVYAPTLDAEEQTKLQFYALLSQTISSVPIHDKLLLLGDFNARVGRDQQLWPKVIGNNGVGNANSNGMLLLGLCAEQELVITNTLFRLRNRDKTTWRHPRSGHWHLLDYVITRQRDRQEVMVTKALRTADDCWSDHRPVFSLLRLRWRKKPTLRANTPRKKYNISAFQDPQFVEQYRAALEHQLDGCPSADDPDAAWDDLKAAIAKAAQETIGYAKRRHQDWFDDNDVTVASLIERKRRARLAWEDCPSSTTKKAAFQRAKAEAQTALRNMQNDWWTKKAEEIQGFADRHESRNFYAAIREVYGPWKPSLHTVEASTAHFLPIEMRSCHDGQGTSTICLIVLPELLLIFSTDCRSIQSDHICSAPQLWMRSESPSASYGETKHRVRTEFRVSFSNTADSVSS